MNKFPGGICFYCADQNTHRDRSRGITRYTLGLLSHLQESGELDLSAVTSRSSIEIPIGVPRINLPFKSDHIIGRLAADHLHPLLLPRIKADIWHYPKGFLPWGIQVRAKRVGTIADVMLQYDADVHPRSRSGTDFTYWLAVLRRSIERFDLILTVSKFSERSILEFCDRYRLNCPPIIVTYEGVEVSRPPETEMGSKGDYVVHLASDQPYKATTWLVQQWSVLAKMKKQLPELKLVGTLDPEAAGLVAAMKNVSVVPSLARAELEDLIARARALLLPSEIEGFGIPSVEAYLLGTPVAYAKQTALEEIVGFGSPGGFLRNRDSFAAALDEVLDLDQAAIKAKAADFQARYNWNDCTQRTLAAYRTLL